MKGSLAPRKGPAMPQGGNKMRNRGFTLVELLIVVVILALLAAIVLPRFSNASQSARASMLADDLRIFRTQLTIFKGQHCGISAGYPGLNPSATPTEAAFIDHMTKQTTDAGAVAPAPNSPNYPYGPYLREVPTNPVNGKSNVLMVADNATFPATASGNYGWVYQPSTLTLRSDATGADETGRLYTDY